MVYRNALFITAALALLSGCVDRHHSRYDGVLESKPSISVERSMHFDASEYRTFSISSGSGQMHDAIRMEMEKKGYMYVASGGDLSVNVDATSVYRKVEVEPQIYEVYHPPGTYHPYYHGKPYDPHANYYYYGHHSKVVRPGYTDEYHEPRVQLVMYDGSKEVWRGMGDAISNTEDVEMSGKYIIRDILRKFPDHRGL